MLQDILIPFIAILLAELGDKTQFAIFLLASRTKKYFHLIAGVFLAFFVADGIAILLGNYVTYYIPLELIKPFSGVVFIIFGVLMLLNGKEEKLNRSMHTPFLSSFLLVLAAEFGDKTQIASGVFATQYNSLDVLIGVLSALFLVSLIAIVAGKQLKARLDQTTMNHAAGIVFLVLGILFLF